MKVFAMACVCGLAATANAVTVHVEVRGTVEWNYMTTGAYAGVHAGDAAVMSFDVDSDVYVNGTYPTRGYVITQGTFTLQAGTGSAGFVSPLPAGTVPYFVIRNNDPMVDGFVVSSSLDYPERIPMAVGINNRGLTFLRTFDNGNVLPSLNILDAVGTYGFENMSSYNWGIGFSDFDHLYITYESITISLPTPPCDPDVNCDGAVNGFDVEATEQAVNGDFANFCQATADLNGDGAENGFDIEVEEQRVNGEPC